VLDETALQSWRDLAGLQSPSARSSFESDFAKDLGKGQSTTWLLTKSSPRGVTPARASPHPAPRGAACGHWCARLCRYGHPRHRGSALCGDLCRWVTACMGAACAIAQWQIVVMGVVLVLVILAFGGPFEKAVDRRWPGRPREVSDQPPDRTRPPGAEM